TSCDLGVRMCTLPCTADEPASYACIGGERVFCATDPSLPCTACPGVCTADQFCDATATCTPKRAAGEPCVTADECLSNDCMPTGTCAVGQGEPCTPATCDGACAMSPSGETFCIRRGCPANCEAMTTGGYQWTCVSYWDQTYTYCVPLEDCIWQDPCATFANSTCGQSCGTTGRCITYCVPDELPRN
ncbi:MAG: hypothetical protein K8H88_00665, partial [Sandaracinaceae bacterium]|nr:hypothetical protein [Sandaracinaceae bacterium]